MLPTPYQLKSQTENPVQFYQDVHQFTDVVLDYGFPMFTTIINDFSKFSETNQQKKYKPGEHLMEILMAGVFWTNYRYHFSKQIYRYELMFNTLYVWRKKYPKYKTAIDNLRGKLAYRWLTKNYQNAIPIRERFAFMNAWLNCTKEFTQEYERLQLWNSFMQTLPVQQQQQFWSDALLFSDWFISEAQTQLGKYTQCWEDFMVETYPLYKKREDFIFCTRIPSEYHLNMVAAEVMNRALKPGFEATKNKIVLLPTCMTRGSECRAEKLQNKLTCCHCSETCQVSKITRRLNKQGIVTVLIPHSSGFSDFLKPWQNSTDTALIGVACVLNLITGGYEMQKLNIPSQCVFLDACGCKKHWLSGMPTELNENQLYNLLIHERHTEPAYSSCG